MASLFPIFLSLDNRHCVVAGGGQVAERKVENLLEYPVSIDVISPEATLRLQEWANSKQVNWIRRPFRAADIQGAFLVFAATDDQEVNRQVASLCKQAGVMVNAVDDPGFCDFYIPSTIRRNSLVVAISTEGKSPAYAKRLRRQLEDTITDQHGQFVDLLGEQRENVKNAFPDIRVRQAIFEALANLDILDLLAAGEEERVRERVEACMSLWRD